jgi:hypothetical protein
MPKSKRDFLKRRIAHAHSDIIRAAEHCIAIQAQFEEAHPDYSQYLDLIISNLLTTNKWIEDFSTKAWGHGPADWDTWRNLRER